MPFSCNIPSQDLICADTFNQEVYFSFLNCWPLMNVFLIHLFEQPNELHWTTKLLANLAVTNPRRMTMILYMYWPLYRICDGDHILPIAGILAPNYLQHENPAMHRNSVPDVKWHDGGKGLFKLRMKLQSTIYTNVSDGSLENKQG